MFLGPRRPPGVHGRPLLRESGKANGTGDIVTSTATHGAYEGGADQAAKVYEGYQPLLAEDVADVIAYGITRPAHVNMDLMIVRPRAQAHNTKIARGTAAALAM